MELKKWLHETARMLSYLIFPMPTPEAEANDASSMECLEQLEKMRQQIQALIRDQEERRNSSSTDKCRLQDLREELFAADDVLDLYGYYVLKARIAAQSQSRSSSSKRKRGDREQEGSGLLPHHIRVPIPKELSDKAKEIVEKFDRLTREWEDFRLWWTDGLTCHADTKGKLETSSFLHGPVHGREHEKERIIDILIKENGPSSSSVSLLPIAGMAGIGKTTLAQLVYVDPRVADKFDLKGWVFVGGDLDVKTITKHIIEAFTDDKCELERLNELHKKLNQIVRGKTFFLVLDDVWGSTAELWNALLASLVNARSGRIVVTSQDVKVTNIRQAHRPYILEYLPLDHCWSLFKELAFEDAEDAPPELLEVGRKIVDKCNGLPLAVKALGTSLFRETKASKWDEILNNGIWESGERESHAFAAIKLSYNRMPLYLKQGFVFFSLFPRGHVFLKDNIIRLWMSLGFLSEPMEDIGDRLIKDLLRWSMIQKKPNFEETEGFFLHDFIHNLAESMAGEDFLTMVDNTFIRMEFSTFCSLRNKRYLSFLMYNLENSVGLQPLQESKTLRLLQFVVDPRNRLNKCHFNIDLPDKLFNDLKHLRALDFSNAVIKILPDSVDNLKQLRYLALTNTGIERLPESICCLYNLETLELTKCPLIELPEGIENLVKLRHLNFQRWFYICMPRGIRKLTRLITLPRFDVGSGSWHCKISDLKDLVKLKGEVCIGGLSDVACIEEVRVADLHCKEHIQVLRLDWSGGMPGECEHPTDTGGIQRSPCQGQCMSPRQIQEQVLECLRPNFNLRELHISNYCGPRFPSWLSNDSFTKLVKISIVGGKGGSTFLPTLGLLPALKILLIESMQNVQYINREFSSLDVAVKGFPSLEKLEFSDMIRWSDWSGVEEGDFCSLNTLRLVDCQKLSLLPEHLSASLAKLVVKHCDRLTRIPILPSLSCLILKGRFDEEIFSSLNLPSLRILKACNSSNIRSLSFNYQTLPLLEMVVIHECRNLQSVTGFSTLRSLKFFKIRSCVKVQFCQDEEMPQLLHQLEISHCPYLNSWSLLHWKKLETQLNNSEELQALADLSESESDDDETD